MLHLIPWQTVGKSHITKFANEFIPSLMTNSNRQEWVTIGTSWQRKEPDYTYF